MREIKYKSGQFVDWHEDPDSDGWCWQIVSQDVDRGYVTLARIVGVEPIDRCSPLHGRIIIQRCPTDTLRHLWPDSEMPWWRADIIDILGVLPPLSINYDEAELDLRESGMLWLINRCMFHRVGYALAVTSTGFLLMGDGEREWTFPEDMTTQLEAAYRTLGESAVGTLLNRAGPEAMSSETVGDADER